MKTLKKSTDPNWMYSGLYREWIPNLTDPVRLTSGKPNRVHDLIWNNPVQAEPSQELEENPGYLAPLRDPDHSHSEGLERLREVNREVEQQRQRGEKSDFIKALKEAAEKRLPPVISEPDIVRNTPEQKRGQSRKQTAKQTREHLMGYAHYGSRTHCIYTGLEAEEVDHAPSFAYVQHWNKKHGKEFPGQRLTVCSTRAFNRTLATNGASCLTMRVAMGIIRLESKESQSKRTEAAKARRKWSTSNECPCTACASAQPLLRLTQCLNEPLNQSKLMPLFKKSRGH